MVDLMGQYSKIKNEIDRNIISSIESGRFVNGPIVKEFSENLSNYLNVKNGEVVIINKYLNYNFIKSFFYLIRLSINFLKKR